MLKDNRITVGMNDGGSYAGIIPRMSNRHGIIAGATGTGKTVTLKVLAESFSELGVPVFIADVKGDVAGLSKPGVPSDDMTGRIERFGIGDSFNFTGYPVNLWDVFGRKGMQLRTTVSEMGPLLLSRIMNLNELQSDLLSIAFRLADENGLLLQDTKDLKAMINWLGDHREELSYDYGNISPASVAAMVRAVSAIEAEGGDVFFGTPALDINDWLKTADDGRGMINILDSSSLVSTGGLYSTFLLWLLSELFENLPEVGDCDRPKIVFFFDEAHLLFKDASKALLEKIEQVVKLVRSRGVGIYFCTQNPSDIPDAVLAQLGNKIQHGLRAYTPSEQKSVKAIAESFRINPDFDTMDTILNLGTGQAVVSFLDEDGAPGIAEKVSVLPPRSSFGSISDEERIALIDSSALNSKYKEATDELSAYETLSGSEQDAETGKTSETPKPESDQKLEGKSSADTETERETVRPDGIKQAKPVSQRKGPVYSKPKKREKAVSEKVGRQVAGTVGRSIGQQLGSAVGGKFGRKVGGNAGAELARGLFETLLK